MELHLYFRIFANALKITLDVHLKNLVVSRKKKKSLLFHLLGQSHSEVVDWNQPPCKAHTRYDTIRCKASRGIQLLVREIIM